MHAIHDEMSPLSALDYAQLEKMINPQRTRLPADYQTWKASTPSGNEPNYLNEVMGAYADTSSYAVWPEPHKHAGQYRYGTLGYIKIINSFDYNEQCIFKPMNYLARVIKHIATMRKAKEAGNMRANIPFALRELLPSQRSMRRDNEYSDYYKASELVLNFGKDNPFSAMETEHIRLYRKRMFNYDLYKLLCSDKETEELKQEIKRLLLSTSNWNSNKAINNDVSDRNRALMKMLNLL